MARISLSTVWINADPDGDGSFSEAFMFESLSSLSRNRQDNIDFFGTSDGGVIVERRPGRVLTWSLSAPLATLAEVEWLWAHVGDELCFRDHRGQKIFGVYAGASDDVLHIERSGVQLTVTETPRSEAV